MENRRDFLKTYMKSLWFNGFMTGYTAGMATAVTLVLITDMYISAKPTRLTDSIASALNGRR